MPGHFSIFQGFSFSWETHFDAENLINKEKMACPD
jgi:hypothetical protein